MGKIKGPLPKFWILHLWRVWYDSNKIELLLVFSLTIKDVELNELYWCFVFDGWLLVLFCPWMMSSHIWRLIVLSFGLFWWSIHVWVHLTSFLSFRSLPNEFPRLDPSFPKLGLFPPQQGLLCLKPLLRSFFLSEYSIVIRMSKRVYILMYKFLFIRLIGFWGLWLFNFPRFFTLNFSI
jgi:hypothetical protein